MTRSKYADVFIEAAEDTSKTLEFRRVGDTFWRESTISEEMYEYRIKPNKRTVRFYNYIDHEGNIKVSVDTPPPSAQWVSEEQNVEL